jgi:hypothetical protein
VNIQYLQINKENNNNNQGITGKNNNNQGSTGNNNNNNQGITGIINY